MSRLVSVNIETSSASFESYAAMQEGMYFTSQRRVEFTSFLPDDKAMVIGNVIHIPEKLAYKFIFMNNNVSDQSIQFAINHALNKIYRFIDNYKA